MSETAKPPRHRLLGVAAAGALVAACCVAQSAPETVTFAFAPPPGAAFVQREIFVETARVGRIQKQITLASEIAVRVEQEGGRVLLASRIERAAAARDGKASDPEMVAAMTGAETAILIKADGVLARVDGMRRLTERLIPTFQAEERAAIEKRLRENRVEDRLRASWFETTEILAGQTLELARDYFFEAAWPTDDGWVRHQTLLRLGPWETTPHGRRLRLQLAYVDDARATVPGALRLEPKARGGFSPAAPRRLAKGHVISGNSSRLVDPATLIVWKDQAVRRLQQRIELSEEMTATVSSEEKSDISVEPAVPARAGKPVSH